MTITMAFALFLLFPLFLWAKLDNILSLVFPLHSLSSLLGQNWQSDASIFSSFSSPLLFLGKTDYLTLGFSLHSHPLLSFGANGQSDTSIFSSFSSPFSFGVKSTTWRWYLVFVFFVPSVLLWGKTGNLTLVFLLRSYCPFSSFWPDFDNLLIIYISSNTSIFSSFLVFLPPLLHLPHPDILRPAVCISDVINKAGIWGKNIKGLTRSFLLLFVHKERPMGAASREAQI